MLIKMIITLLSIYDNENIAVDKFNQYDLARLNLSGFLDDEYKLTGEGRVIVQEILTYVERVL